MACIIDEKILNSFKNFILKSKIDSASLEALEDNVVSSYVINAIKQFYEEYENHKAWIDDNVEKSFDIENLVVVVVVERVTVEMDSTERVRLVTRQSHISDIKGITKVSDWGGICLIQP
jgi:hypothetical protein